MSEKREQLSGLCKEKFAALSKFKWKRKDIFINEFKEDWATQ